MFDRNQLSRVQQKARQVEAMLPSRTVNEKLPFGAEHHHYRLNPPLPLEEIEAFEEKFDIRLPEDYRHFLLEVGNGGAGPAYGVLRLKYWDLRVDCDWDRATNTPIPRVTSPLASYLASPSPLSADAPYDSTWQEELEPLDWVPFQGTITVCSQGCADCVLLVVTGQERGRLVEVSEDWIAPTFFPMPNFLSWYETWQDSVLSSADRVWTGYPQEL